MTPDKVASITNTHDDVVRTFRCQPGQLPIHERSSGYRKEAFGQVFGAGSHSTTEPACQNQALHVNL
jgi:hypothetical protein